MQSRALPDSDRSLRIERQAARAVRDREVNGQQACCCAMHDRNMLESIVENPFDPSSFAAISVQNQFFIGSVNFIARRWRAKLRFPALEIRALLGKTHLEDR